MSLMRTMRVNGNGRLAATIIDPRRQPHVGDRVALVEIDRIDEATGRRSIRCAARRPASGRGARKSLAAGCMPSLRAVEPTVSTAVRPLRLANCGSIARQRAAMSRISPPPVLWPTRMSSSAGYPAHAPRSPRRSGRAALRRRAGGRAGSRARTTTDPSDAVIPQRWPRWRSSVSKSTAATATPSAIDSGGNSVATKISGDDGDRCEDTWRSRAGRKNRGRTAKPCGSSSNRCRSPHSR